MSNTEQLNDGGCAFPFQAHDENRASEWGLSAHDYFAAHALTGLLANCTAITPDDAAKWAMRFADAMLAHRKI